MAQDLLRRRVARALVALVWCLLVAPLVILLPVYRQMVEDDDRRWVGVASDTLGSRVPSADWVAAPKMPYLITCSSHVSCSGTGFHLASCFCILGWRYWLSYGPLGLSDRGMWIGAETLGRRGRSLSASPPWESNMPRFHSATSDLSYS